MNKRYVAFLKRASYPTLVLLLGGFAAGFFNGLLGAGGGIILVLMLSFLLPDDDEGAKSVYPNAIIVMVALSFLTLGRYINAGALKEGVEKPVIVFLGASVGGLLGGAILHKIGSKILKRIFAVLTVISGVLMISR